MMSTTAPGRIVFCVTTPSDGGTDQDCGAFVPHFNDGLGSGLSIKDGLGAVQDVPSDLGHGHSINDTSGAQADSLLQHCDSSGLHCPSSDSSHSSTRAPLGQIRSEIDFSWEGEEQLPKAQAESRAIRKKIARAGCAQAEEAPSPSKASSEAEASLELASGVAPGTWKMGPSSPAGQENKGEATAQSSHSSVLPSSSRWAQEQTSGSVNPYKLQLRNGFIDIADDRDTMARMRSSSSPPSSKNSWEPHEQQLYLDGLEKRASLLGSTVAKLLNTEDESPLVSRETSLGAASADSSSHSTSALSPWSSMSAAHDMSDVARSRLLGSEPQTEPEDVAEASVQSSQPSPPRRGRGARRRGKKQGSGSGSSKASNLPITTYRLGNLPYRVNKSSLASALDHMGFEGTYDFVSVPNANSDRSRLTNLGYGFVNFIRPADAAAFAAAFSELRFPGMTSAKVCTLLAARVQRRVSR